jgi:hypothetical protein
MTSKDHHSLPPPDPTRSPRSRISAKYGRSISTSSADNIYDVDGDGRLDAIEQVMMKYDKDGDGTFSNAEIYDIIQEQLRAERKARNMKRIIVGMGCFLTLLALSNLGTSFAAMFLSKELVADTEEGVMRLQGNGALASVQSAAETVDLIPLSDEEYTQRKLMVLADLEEDPHSHPHRRLKNKKCKKGDLCDGDIMFDNGKMKEKDFRLIEEKCKMQKNVKIRRAKEFDRQADSICSSGTSVVVKQKKPDKNKGTRVGRDNKKDRDVMIVNPGGKRMNVDCVGENCYISGDILLGSFGESCDRNLNDCEPHLICDNKAGKDASARSGTCLIPRFVKIGGMCDMAHYEDACVKGSYCFHEVHKVYGDKGSGGMDIVGTSGSIHTRDAVDPRFKLGTKIGECVRQVGVGNLCDSKFACLEKFTCIGAGGIEIGTDPRESGAVNGASGTVRWAVDVKEGICM